MTDKRLIYAHWLHTVPGIGGRTICALLEYAGTEENIYFLNEERLRALLRPAQASSFLERRKKADPGKLYEALLDKQIAFYPYFHESYPERLFKIPDRPYGLYVKGKLLKGERTAAVIGARECSAYGSHMAEEYGKAFAAAGVTVVSGMARGIDGISQRAAIRAGGRSVSVLGCGVDVCYPQSNREIYEYCARQGALVSEYPPGTAPVARNFPPRNRIISGLSELVLVMEAREKSGTLITVDMALEQGKEVFALPGRATDELSHGCNRLIAQGAGVALSPAAVLSCMGKPEGEAAVTESRQELTEPERRILECTDWYPTPFSDIYDGVRSHPGMGGLTAAQMQEHLLVLCIKGCLGEKGKNYYYRRN